MQRLWHISSAVAANSQGPSTLRDNNVVAMVYRVLCAEYNLEHSYDWWVEPERVFRNDLTKIL